MLTAQILRTLQPKLDPATAETVARSLLAAADRFEINTRRRMAHFIAQLAHESGFRPVAENLNYSAEGLRRTWPGIALSACKARCSASDAPWARHHSHT
jgi:putative chitinase